MFQGKHFSGVLKCGYNIYADGGVLSRATEETPVMTAVITI